MVIGMLGRPPATARPPRRIILTHWNAGAFDPAVLPQLLPELVVCSLLYDEVLIREEDLFTNRRIMRLLAEPSNRRVFEELLAAGLVKLLRLPVADYPAGRKFDPVRLPISARVEEHQLRRSYKGRPWKPTAAEWSVIGILDRLVSEFPGASREHEPFPGDSVFAAQLAEVLEGRERYSLSAHPVFSHIHPQTADEFVRFCREPEAWIRFLRNAGVADPILGPSGGFYRSAAYQYLEQLPGPRAMRRLVESVYAAAYCDRELSDGRYCGSELVELPFSYPAGEASSEIAINVELVPTPAAASIFFGPGIADVLSRTRESPSFEALQSTLEQLGNAESDLDLPTETAFREAFAEVCGVYAAYLGGLLARPSSAPTKITRCAISLWVLARVVGFVMLPHGPFELDSPVLVDAATIGAVEKWGPSLIREFRATLVAPRLQQALDQSVRVRCSRVTLNSTV